MIEIANLAMALRDTAALDAEGKIALQMAEDLAPHTGQWDMIQVFARCRQRMKWLPRVADLLELYKEVVQEQIDAIHAAQQQLQRNEYERMRRDREEHPEKYISFGEIVRECPATQEHVAKLEQRAFVARTQQAAQDNAPKVEECPHCGKAIPMRVADLRGLTIEHLKSIIEAKRYVQAQKEADLAAAKEMLLNAIEAANAPAAKPRKPRTKKGTR